MTGALEEHFEYLSDGVRSQKFRDAIRRVIRPGDVVADLGCGFGVLGLMCLKAGAARVWGIDASDAIEIAKESVARAGLADRYQCVRESTFRAELPEKVDVIICDHVGFFGIDYGIIDMMGDFRRRFLKPEGRVVPGKIRLMLAPISSAECRTKAEAWANAPIPDEFHWLRDYGINTKHPHLLGAEDVCGTPRHVGTVDLGADNPETFSFKACFQIDRDCRIDGIGGWFECELAEGIWMTNSPFAEDKIGRSQIFLPIDEPIEAKSGDSVDIALSIRHDREIITWSMQARGSNRRQRQSTWNSTILTKADLIGQSREAVVLNPMGLARKRVLELADGKRSAQEIEEALLQGDRDLLPSEAELRKLVRRELGRSAVQ